MYVSELLLFVLISAAVYISVKYFAIGFIVNINNQLVNGSFRLRYLHRHLFVLKNRYVGTLFSFLFVVLFDC